MSKRWMVGLGVGAAVLVVGGAIGFSGGDRGGDDSAALGASIRTASSAGAGGSEAMNLAADSVGAPAAFAPKGAASAAQAARAPSDEVVKRASIEVEVKKGSFTDAFNRATAIATATGGFVASSTSSTASDRARLASGSLVLRIPSDRFDEARASLARLGKVRGEQLSGEDVGAQRADIDARLRNLRAQEETIRALMSKAVNVGETLQVQQQLTEVRGQIEQLAAQQAYLTDAVSLATLQVTLSEPGVALHEEEPTSLAKSAERAVDGALTVIGGVVILVGYALPLAALALLAWITWRVARRRPRPATAPAPAA